MYKKSNSFVYKFDVYCQVFETTPSGCTLWSWKLVCFITWTIFFEMPFFRYLSMCFWSLVRHICSIFIWIFLYFFSLSFSLCLLVLATLILLLTGKWDKVLGLNLNDLLIYYDLFFNLGLNTCKKNSLFIYLLVILAYFYLPSLWICYTPLPVLSSNFLIFCICFNQFISRCLPSQCNFNIGTFMTISQLFYWNLNCNYFSKISKMPVYMAKAVRWEKES